MKESLIQMSRYVLIGVGFGIIWAVVQYMNGQIQELKALVSPILIFGVVGAGMWCVRQLVTRIRNRFS